MRITILISRERREKMIVTLGGEAKATVLDGYILDKKYFFIAVMWQIVFLLLIYGRPASRP